MKPLILALLLVVPAAAQQKPGTELAKLRDEFITATKEYKQSLAKLKTIYLENVTKAENKVELSKKLLAEGLISRGTVEDYERALLEARDRVTETDKQIASADDRVTEAMDDTKFKAEYKHAVAQRRKERKPRCAQWTLTTYYRKNARSIESGYRFVCR
jgi:hypothetical protein